MVSPATAPSPMVSANDIRWGSAPARIAYESLGCPNSTRWPQRTNLGWPNSKLAGRRCLRPDGGGWGWGRWAGAGGGLTAGGRWFGARGVWAHVGFGPGWGLGPRGLWARVGFGATWDRCGAGGLTGRPQLGLAQVSELRLGRCSACSQWLTVMFSCVNSPVQIRIPMPISTAPPAPITAA